MVCRLFHCGMMAAGQIAVTQCGTSHLAESTRLGFANLRFPSLPRRPRAIPDTTATPTTSGTPIIAMASQVLSSAAAPLGAMSRTLVQSVNLRHALVLRPILAGGGTSFAVFMVSALAVLVSRVRALIRQFMRIARACNLCSGFGIQRCSMCEGRGLVRWNAKWVHADPCPRCSGTRYCKCQGCGGLFHRRMFAHIPRNAATATNENSYASLDLPLDKVSD
jgi:hypothetical protein